MGILEELAVFFDHRRAFARTDAEYQQGRGVAIQSLTNACTFLIAERGGDQQQAALAQRTLVQQFQGLVHGQVSPVARLRHDRRLDGFKQVAAGRQIVGQRHQRVGATGVHNHGSLRITAALQQVVEFAPRLLQPIGRAVGGEHFGGQLQHHHQRVGRFLRRLLNAFPAWAEQGEQSQQPGQPQRNPRQFAVAAIAAAEQHTMKGLGQDHLPAACAFLPMPEFPKQPAQQGQCQQPFGAKPVRPERAHRRLRRRRRLSRERHSGCCCRKCRLLSTRCSGLLGHSSRITSSTLSSRAPANGQL